MGRLKEKIKCGDLRPLIMQLVTALGRSPTFVVLISLTSCLIFVLTCEGSGIVNSSELAPNNLPNVSDSHLKVQLVFQKEIKHERNTLSPISTIDISGYK
jgi:hypothetical protein